MDRRDALLALGAALVTPLGAAAWVPPTRRVVDAAQRRMQAAAGQRVHLSGRAWPGEAALSVDDRWVFGAHPSVAVAGADGRRAAWGPEGETGDAALLPDALTRRALADLFGPGGVRALILRLGVNGRHRRLALHGDRVVVVIGARAPADAGSQVWVDQETFTVTRVRTATRNGVHDLQLVDWAGPITGGRFPARIHVQQAQRWLRSLTVQP
jgi:hypothetical protein